MTQITVGGIVTAITTITTKTRVARVDKDRVMVAITIRHQEDFQISPMVMVMGRTAVHQTDPTTVEEITLLLAGAVVEAAAVEVFQAVLALMA